MNRIRCIIANRGHIWGKPELIKSKFRPWMPISRRCNYEIVWRRKCLCCGRIQEYTT